MIDDNTAEELDEEMLYEDQMEDQDEQEDEDQPDPILDAFSEAIDGEADEDEVKMAMIGAGATFKNVTRLYNQYMIDAGLAISKADRNQIVQDTLEGLDFESEEQFKDAVSRLVETIQGCSDKQAGSLVRAYAKKNELECYVKPKGEGTRSSWRSTYYDWLVANPDVTEEEAKAYIMGEGDNPDTSENVRRHLSAHLNVFKLATRVVANARAA